MSARMTSWRCHAMLLMAAIILEMGANLKDKADCQCVFPSHWFGQWFDTRSNVMLTNITEVGSCVEFKDNFYLFEDKEIGCYRCVLFEERHGNILQYRESFCSGKASLHSICSTILAESIQYSLIRETAATPPCPFHDAFHFIYNNSSGGACRNPMSYVKPCADSSFLTFHFKKCPDAAYTFDREVKLRCLAVWEDGDVNYFIGKFLSQDLEYRCFMYRLLGSLVYVSMSADRSCRGLRSPTDGPVVLELTQDTFGWPSPKCSFPPWITGKSWRELGGSFRFQPNTYGDVIEMGVPSPVTSSHLDGHSRFRCFEYVTNNASTLTEFYFVSFTTRKCFTGYQCLKFIKKTDEVVELYEAKDFMEHPTDSCQDHSYFFERKRILVPQKMMTSPCPVQGMYYIRTGTNVCPSYLRSGCDLGHSLDIVSTCSTKPGLSLDCLTHWREGATKVVVVVKTTGDKSDFVSCFSLVTTEDSVYFLTDPMCATHLATKDRVSYSLDQQLLSCNVPSIKQALANIQPDTVQSANRPGNAKNHSVSSPEAYKNNYPEERSLDDDVQPRDVNKSRNVIGKLATPQRLTVLVCFLLSRMMSDYSVLRVLIRLDR